MVSGKGARACRGAERMKSTKMSTRVQHMDPDWLLTHTQDETEQTIQFWTLDLRISGMVGYFHHEA
jgi:hypothetical protein